MELTERKNWHNTISNWFYVSFIPITRDPGGACTRITCISTIYSEGKPYPNRLGQWCPVALAYRVTMSCTSMHYSTSWYHGVPQTKSELPRLCQSYKLYMVHETVTRLETKMGRPQAFPIPLARERMLTDRPRLYPTRRAREFSYVQ